jgi:pentatricopeptide repeat protein
MTMTGQRQRQRLFTTFLFFSFLCSSRISSGGVYAFTSSPSSPSSLSSSIILQQQQQTRRRNGSHRFGGKTTAAATCSTRRNPLSSDLYSSSSSSNHPDDESSSAERLAIAEKDEEDRQPQSSSSQQQQQQQQQQQKEEEEETKIDIYSLRDEIRRLANIRSSNAPHDATTALRKMFQSYYNSQNRNNNNNNKRGERDPRGDPRGDPRSRSNHLSRSAQINVRDCTQVIGIWVKSRSPNSPQQALAILNEMIEIYKKDKNNYIRPNVVTYTSVMNAFARCGDLEGAYKIFEMQVDDYKNNSNYKAKPNSRTMKTVINACTKSTISKSRLNSSKSNRMSNNNNNNNKSNKSESNINKEAPYIAERILQTMDDWYKKGLLDEGPTTITYTGVISCWSKSNHPDGPQNARKILMSMIEQYEQTGNTSVQPNTITYSSVLDAYAKRGDIKNAKEIWDLMIKDYESGNRSARPEVQIYTVMIKAWSRAISSPKFSEIAPYEAEKLLKQMIDLYSRGELKEGPNTFTYGTLINCWSKSTNPEGPTRALQILQSMLEQYKNEEKNQLGYKQTGNNSIRPNSVTYAIVMDAYARRGDVQGALIVWNMMKDDYHNNMSVSESDDANNTNVTSTNSNDNNTAANPYNIRIYGALITAYSKSRDTNAPYEAEKLMKEMEDLYDQGIMTEKPNSFTYSILINCWSKSNHPDAPKNARKILRKMMNDASQNPDAIIFNSVLDACARQGDIDGALEVWELMMNGTNDTNTNEQHSSSSSKYKIRPNVRTFSTLIFAWSKSKSTKAPYEAEKLISEMIDLYDNKKQLMEGPNTIAYSIAINCWSKSSVPDAPQRARKLLDSMIIRSKREEDNNKISNCIPNAITYHSVLDAYSKHGDIVGADEVFTMMKMDKNVKPELLTYSILIDTWSKSNNRDDAPKEAELLLMEMIDLYSKGELDHGPDTIIYSTVVNCWSKSNLPEAPQRVRDILDSMILHYKQTGNESVRPNTITYNSVMDAYARQGDIDGTLEVWELMMNDYRSSTSDVGGGGGGGDKGGNGSNGSNNMRSINARPNVPTYNTLISAWAKSRRSDAPNQAERLLKEMIDLYIKGDLKDGPDTIIMSSVINCWSKSNKLEAPKHARSILDDMILQSKGENGNKAISPNRITYNSVADAYARQGNINGTLEVIKLMEDDYESSGNIHVKPDILTYNILIGCWSKSGKSNAPIEAEKIMFNKMNETNIITYCGLINCWSKSNLPEAPRRARDILESMVSKSKDSGNYGTPNPNKVAYNSVLDAYARQGNFTGANEVFAMMGEGFRSGSVNVKPDVTTYNTLMNALSKSDDDDGAIIINAAEKLLIEINTRYKDGDLEGGANDVTYTTMISCLEKFEGTEERIRELKLLRI